MHKDDSINDDQISTTSDDVTDGNFSSYFDDDPMGAGVSIYGVYQRLVRFVRRAWSRRSHDNNDDIEMTFVRSKPQRIEALCRITKFSKNELKLIYQGFKQACPTGIVNESTFKEVYAQFFPQGDASQYAHYVFKAFDHDGSGTINFQEFVLGLSTISRGSPTEKLQWTFNLYDINGDGCITREEMREIISSIYNLLGRFTEPSVSAEATRDHADRVFDKLDLNKDGIVTFDEFLETCLHDENITKSLNLLDTVL
ncbi:hypothetical protein JTE90_022552 [Oedothorax gibbosus]|uniref:EF-hand domain-containing protein n=1 Tax=Oedothorax gibbosus TaxID=931172 RepID=A0AAV6UXX5_9ARAC|nr:hypothetical protein JTE90_022552 [Oedothorax gibbosus]